MSNSPFHIGHSFTPAGDQPKAIEALVSALQNGSQRETLLGVTGSGKTFTAANVLYHIGKPTLVIAHNKTLAAQLAQEYREFFPENAVHYFVSYYDYYQPEAYVPTSDTYIEKEAQINEEIERLRHASTQALLTRSDVIIVASVSCIYGLGSPEEYEKIHIRLEKNMKVGRAELLRILIDLYYERTNADLSPGLFRAIGNSIEFMPVSEKFLYRVDFEGNTISSISKIDSVSQRFIADVPIYFIFPAKHYVTSPESRLEALKNIEKELEVRLKELNEEGKLLEAERLKRRTRYDISMIREVGYTNGIENYSLHFDGRKPGEPPHTLLSYFPKKKNGEPDFLTIIDESHVTLPQIAGMYAGDQSRKNTLVEHGFRLPSAKDNRPLTFDEFIQRVGPVIFTSATPGEYEKKVSEHIVEQVIRPTGLVDPEISIFPIQEKGAYLGQIEHFITEAVSVIEKGKRVLATTLTKKMAEELSEFLTTRGVKTRYLHSEIKTLERIEILTAFRKGEFDCLVGVNLLREGLDLPEVAFIGILDADKEGFLRSETSLIQTIGRAARNSEGKVYLYADVMTGSMERAVKETQRRRTIQLEYNRAHGITPTTVQKKISDITESLQREHVHALEQLSSIESAEFEKNPKAFIKKKEAQMNEAVKILDFETAALLRDEIQMLEEKFFQKKNKAQRPSSRNKK